MALRHWNATYNPTTWGMVQAGGVYAKPSQYASQDDYTCVLLDVAGLDLVNVNITSTWTDGQRLDAFTFFRDDLEGPYGAVETSGNSPLSLYRAFSPGEGANHTDLFVGTGIPAGGNDLVSVGLTQEIVMAVAIDYFGESEPRYVVDFNCDDFIHRPVPAG